MTTQNNNVVYMQKNPREVRVNRLSVVVCAFFLGILALSIALNGIAQEPDVHFIDVDGKTIAEGACAAQRREGLSLR